MRSQDAKIGTRVRISGHFREPEMRGMTGVVLKRYGREEYLALDVLLDAGGSQLFWHHELEEAGGESGRRHDRVRLPLRRRRG